MADTEQTEKDTPMSDQVIAVLQNQIHDLQRKNTDLLADLSKVRQRNANLKRENEEMSEAIIGMQAHLDEWEKTLPDIQALSEKIEEWEPIVNKQEESEGYFNSLIQERDSLQEELDSIKSSYENMTSQVETMKAQLALPVDEANSRLSETNKRLANLYHEQAWNHAISSYKGQDGHGITLRRNVPVTKLWSEIGYVPEGETPDETQVMNSLTSALESVDYLFMPSPEMGNGAVRNGEPPKPREPKPPGPGVPRGTPETESGVLELGESFYRSNKPMTSADQKAFYEAYTGGKIKEATPQPPSSPRRR